MAESEGYCLKLTLLELKSMYDRFGTQGPGGIHKDGEMTIVAPVKCPSCSFVGSLTATVKDGKIIAPTKIQSKGACAKEN